jgi:hypothetical protein
MPGSLASSVFLDITAGDNIVPCVVGTQDCTTGSLGYTAGPGYDLVTGLGSVNFLQLQLEVLVGTYTTLSVSATQVPLGAPVTISVTSREFNGAIPPGEVQIFDTFAPNTTQSFLTAIGLDRTGTATGSLP